MVESVVNVPDVMGVVAAVVVFWIGVS